MCSSSLYNFLFLTFHVLHDVLSISFSLITLHIIESVKLFTFFLNKAMLNRNSVKRPRSPQSNKKQEIVLFS